MRLGPAGVPRRKSVSELEEKMNLPEEAKRIMKERFGKDTVLSLATVEGGLPHVREVNA